MNKNILFKSVKLISSVLTALIFAFFFTACEMPNLLSEECPEGGTSGSNKPVTLQLSTGSARTVFPGMPSISKYELYSVLSEDDATDIYSNLGTEYSLLGSWSDLSDASISVLPNDWTFVLYAYDDNNKLVLYDKLEDVRVYQPTTLNFVLTDLAFLRDHGVNTSGIIDVTLRWPNDADVYSVEIFYDDYYVTDDETITCTLDDWGTDVPGYYSVTYHNDAAGAPCYDMLSFKLKNKQGNLVASTMELIMVVHNLTSSKVITLEASDINGVPAAPTDLSAVHVPGIDQSSSVALSWTDASVTETGFFLEYSTDNGTTYKKIYEVSAGATTYLHNGVERGSSILYRISARNDFGDSPFCSAQYDDKYFLLNIKSDDGSNQTMELATGESTTLNAGALSRDKLVFSGWSSSEYGAVEYREGSTFTMGSENVTLYTFWSCPMINIEGSKNGSYIQGNGNFIHNTSDFAAGQYEIPYELWYKVRVWAEANGYSFVSIGIEGFSGWTGEPTEEGRMEPGTNMLWNDAITWCNAYSVMLGRTPCYYDDASFSTVYKNSVYNKTVYTNWDADGFRLPSSSEWFYTASCKGVYKADMPSGADAVYSITSGAKDLDGNGEVLYLEDVAWTLSNHTNDLNPVGTKKANIWNMYDVTGNVWEWVWDWYTETYPSTIQSDYRGPASGTQRSLVSGSALSENWRMHIGYVLPWGMNSSTTQVGLRVFCSGTYTEAVNEIKTHTVTFDGNGATGGLVPNPQNKTNDIPLVITGNSGSLVRAGYKFIGWNTAASGYGESFEEDEHYSSDTDLKLYAQWQALNTISYTVDLPDEGSITFSDTVNVAQGDALKITVSEAFSSYQWALDGDDLPEETAQSITITADDTNGMTVGTHTLTVYVEDECSASLIITVTL